MRIMALAALAIGLGSGNAAARTMVLVCMNPGPNAPDIVRAQGYASRIFDAIGVRLRWQSDARQCPGGIVITLGDNTPESRHPGALAYALPYAGDHAVVFFDRVRAAVPPRGTAALLAHVLSHEIVHILQGVAQHSRAGLMKERWEYADYLEMQRRPLPIAPDDIRLIERGLHARAASK